MKTKRYKFIIMSIVFIFTLFLVFLLYNGMLQQNFFDTSFQYEKQLTVSGVKIIGKSTENLTSIYNQEVWNGRTYFAESDNVIYDNYFGFLLRMQKWQSESGNYYSVPYKIDNIGKTIIYIDDLNINTSRLDKLTISYDYESIYNCGTNNVYHPPEPVKIYLSNENEDINIFQFNEASNSGTKHITESGVIILEEDSGYFVLKRVGENPKIIEGLDINSGNYKLLLSGSLKNECPDNGHVSNSIKLTNIQLLNKNIDMIENNNSDNDDNDSNDDTNTDNNQTVNDDDSTIENKTECWVSNNIFEQAFIDILKTKESSCTNITIKGNNCNNEEKQYNTEKECLLNNVPKWYETTYLYLFVFIIGVVLAFIIRFLIIRYLLKKFK